MKPSLIDDFLNHYFVCQENPLFDSTISNAQPITLILSAAGLLFPLEPTSIPERPVNSHPLKLYVANPPRVV